MALDFTPKFVDLVRGTSTGKGTGPLPIKATPSGFRAFGHVLNAGDEFFYTATNLDRPTEFEVGRGVWLDDGSIERHADGAAVDFGAGTKLISLVASARWYEAVDERLAEATRYAATGGVERTTADRLGDQLSVRDFGAKGDGTSDDTAAIQSAVTSGAREILFGDGIFLVSDAITLPSDIILTGRGKGTVVRTSGTNKRIFTASGQAHIQLRGLTLEGNLTGNGATSIGAGGGEGVCFLSCTDVTVEACIIDKIGHSARTGYASGLKFHSCSRITVRDNLFLALSKSASGADIDFAYYCGDAIVTGNRSMSDQDSFIYGAAVSATATDTIRHVVTGNIGLRANGSAARSGILIPYDAKPAYAVVSGNILSNFPANGIYVSAGANNSADSAGVTIADNIIRFCGGSAAMTGISAGIYVAGRNGAAVTGNLVEKSGVQSDGAARANAVPGILIVGSSRNIAVTGNVVTMSSDYGIELRNINGGVEMSGISLSANLLHDNVAGGIYLFQAGVTATMADVSITGNQVRQEVNDGHGLKTNFASSAPPVRRLSVTNNLFSGKAGSAKDGFYAAPSTVTSWRMSGNSFVNFARGLVMGNYAMADREVGTNAIIYANSFDSCTTGVFLAVQTGTYGHVFNCSFTNCGAATNDANRALNAVRTGTGVEVRRAAAPGDGSWVVGDRVLFTAPTAGGHVGAVCTAAGTPGTWKNYGAVAA